ncbi:MULTISPECIES: hypothetical protein [Pseudonocardiaceae]|uniref:RiboL-PSP-HEPN domain-containing protein n=1 Tax=Prauserella endophytica TaxID=1592324 RepID=A0ABY2RTR0_9PSEU|nr:MULTISPECIES: hypothetical protein [Pseudonocardiaceae]TKG60256.1 hypothetical protein FCN18_35830 [Prauserella endophytica]
MPRKKSGKTAARKFRETTERIDRFTDEVAGSGLGDLALTWAYEAALIKTYVAFERLMLDCIVAAINNDTSTISAQTGIVFPKHLTDEICEYLVTGGGYFDFKGRDGLIKTIKGYVPDDHWLLAAVKQEQYKSQLNIMVALRNYAAHESPASKRKAIDAIGQQQIGSAGSWIKRRQRFSAMTNKLTKLATEIETRAPY